VAGTDLVSCTQAEVDREFKERLRHLSRSGGARSPAAPASG
jgi:hypothetical protein